jgi:hypothetical protein
MKKNGLPKVDKQPMLRNTEPQAAPPASVEKITELELATMHSLKREIEAMKERQRAMSKELTILSADIYHKEDEFNAKMSEIALKYGLKHGQRELDFKTGSIIKRGNG